MFYISPQLTILMLAVVPPISLGAVSEMHVGQVMKPDFVHTGVLWPIPQAFVEQDPGSPW